MKNMTIQKLLLLNVSLIMICLILGFGVIFYNLKKTQSKTDTIFSEVEKSTHSIEDFINFQLPLRQLIHRQKNLFQQFSYEFTLISIDPDRDRRFADRLLNRMIILNERIRKSWPDNIPLKHYEKLEEAVGIALDISSEMAASSSNEILQLAADSNDVLKEVSQTIDDIQTILDNLVQQQSKSSLKALDNTRYSLESIQKLVGQINIQILVTMGGVITLIIFFQFYFTPRFRRMASRALQAEMAEEASQAKSQFLANMSHEIRTPLNGIIGIAELFGETGLNHTQNRYIQTIQSEAKNLLALISDILDLSKIEVGRVELEAIPFDLIKLVDDLSQLAASKGEQKNVEFIHFISLDVPTLLIGDPKRLRQVLINLTDNAVKFTEKGDVYLEVTLVEERENSAKLKFSVQDTGIGIPLEKQATIFDRFTQADGSTTRRFGGTGLGTTISKQLVELMGGSIAMQSRVNDGSTFWFTLPVKKQVLETPPSNDLSMGISDLNVLVVNPNRHKRYLLTRILQHWGCRVEAFDSPADALFFLRHQPKDKNMIGLIITEIQMEPMGGFDFVQEIRRLEIHSRTPVLAITAIGLKGQGQQCRELGIDGYLTRPITRDYLYKAIMSVLGLIAEDAKSYTLPPLVTRHSIAETFRKRFRILLTEDYPTNQQIALKHISDSGYQVDLAENGKQAIDAYQSKNYDLILMDVQMPVMDGYEATRHIREIERKQMMQSGITIGKIPIIALTAYAMSEDKEQCLQAGMDGHISKPFNRDQLLNLLDSWLLPEEPPNSTAITDSDPTDPEMISNFPIDYDRALSDFDGDTEFLANIVDGFLDRVQNQLITIQSAIQSKDSETVRKEAHSIKGGAGNLYAETMQQVALNLETEAKDGNLAKSLDILHQLETEFNQLKSFVKFHSQEN